jgi:Starch-binding associating with outer membrane
MKSLKSLSIFMVALLVFSCKFGDTNIDPANIDKARVTLPVLLTSAQASLAYNLGGRASWYTGMFTNHLTGVNAQPQDFSRYLLGEGDVDGLWRDMYAEIMNGLNTIIIKSTDENSPHYRGVARVLMAQSLGTVSSFWGDVPFADAFQGPTGNTTPKYDTQEAVYATVQKLLDDAIVDLNSRSSAFSPGDDDLVFGGELSDWIRTANAFKARFFMHTSKRNQGASASALAALRSAISSVGQNAAFEFGSSQTNASPWFQLNNQRPDVRVNADFIALLNSLNDPRRTPFIRNTGSGPFVGNLFGTINSKVPFITFAECKFIEAEALVRTGAGGADAAYRAAIRASLDETLGSTVSDAVKTAYVEANGTLTGSNDARLERIMTQKHIALFTQPETWTDYRRTGFPRLRANPDPVRSAINPQGAIPRRFTYPISERLYNGANIPTKNPSLQEPKLWWDN